MVRQAVVRRRATTSSRTGRGTGGFAWARTCRVGVIATVREVAAALVDGEGARSAGAAPFLVSSTLEGLTLEDLPGR